MGNKIVNLLVFLMKTGGKLCPPGYLLPINENEKELLIIAATNKAIPFLFHFLDCSPCRKKLSKNLLKKLSDYQKFALIWPLLYQNEKQSLGKFCRKNKIKCVLIKDFSSYPKMKFHQQYLTGVDLDILVEENDMPKIESFLKKQGYQLKEHLKLKDKQGKIYYQEKNFIRPKINLSMDLHLQLAIPHHDEFSFLSWKIIKKVSREIFQNSSYQKQNGLYIPNMEYFLLSLIIHYLGSDLLRGLRNLFDIVQFANLYDQQIDWERFLTLTKRFKISYFSYFIFFLGCHFGLSFPQNLKRNIRIPFRVRFLIPYWSVEKIAIFPPVEKWNLKNKEARKIFYENFFIKLLLSDSVAVGRLIRPRVILFLLKVVSFWINKFYFRLYQKFFLSKAIQRQLPANGKKDFRRF